MAEPKKTKKILDNPFEHKGLEYKQNLVAWAASLRQSNRAEDLLAASLIYSSVCEYMAKHLLESLKYLFYKSTYKDFTALVYVDYRDTSDKRTLNQSADELKHYGFPDKPEIIALMRKIATSRNVLMHQLAETEPDQLETLDSKLEDLMKDSNELIDKVDIVYAGLGKILAPAQQAQEEVDSNKPTKGEKKSSNS